MFQGDPDGLLRLSELKLDSEKSLDKLMKEIAQGHIEPISSFLQLHPEKVFFLFCLIKLIIITLTVK